MESRSESIGQDTSTVFVGGVNFSANDQSLLEFFAEQFSGVLHCKIIRDGSGRSKGYGFVTFKSVGEAERAKSPSACLMFQGKELNVHDAYRRVGYPRGSSLGVNCYTSIGRNHGYRNGFHHGDRYPTNPSKLASSESSHPSTHATFFGPNSRVYSANQVEEDIDANTSEMTTFRVSQQMGQSTDHHMFMGPDGRFYHALVPPYFGASYPYMHPMFTGFCPDYQLAPSPCYYFPHFVPGAEQLETVPSHIPGWGFNAPSQETVQNASSDPADSKAHCNPDNEENELEGVEANAALVLVRLSAHVCTKCA